MGASATQGPLITGAKKIRGVREAGCVRGSRRGGIGARDWSQLKVVPATWF